MTSRPIARTLNVLSSVDLLANDTCCPGQPILKRFGLTRPSSMTIVRFWAYALLLLAPFAWAQDYAVTKFPTLGGTATRAFSINDAGQVVGGSFLLSDGNTHAFLWTSSAGIEDLGTLGGGMSVAYGINQNGEVVGQADNTFNSYAFSWTQSGGMQDLGALGSYSSAYAANSSGQVVGASPVGAADYVHAFLWTEAAGMQDLGTLQPDSLGSLASSINDNGQVVGSSYTTGTTIHAFLWTQSGGMQDLGTLGQNSFASGINNSGQVVGFSDTSDGFAHAFLWTQATGMRDLGVLPGFANSSAGGINTTGQVVGSSWSGAQGSPFLWTQSGGLKALGPFGNTPITNGDAINDAGLILASLYNGKGYSSYLLTPIQFTTSTSLVSSLNPSIQGQAITWTATVTNFGSVAPTGTVNFKWGPDGIGTGRVNVSGVATFTTSILKPGPYKITAVYKGDVSNLGSSSAVLHQGVKRARP
jgi:probable HAF family extracellular repeat protein